MALQPTPSLRGNKHDENVHRPLMTNLIGTLDHTGAWTPSAAFAAHATLHAALTQAAAGPNLPLLWAFRGDNMGWRIKFGFDVFVLSQAVGVPPGTMMKIGHVALENDAIISGEIAPAGGGWVLDNNSGAWGAMNNNGGKTDMLGQIAQFMNVAGGINVQAKRAYSRHAWKRVFQQTTVYERLFR
jgi:hypothetical protein